MLQYKTNWFKIKTYFKGVTHIYIFLFLESSGDKFYWNCILNFIILRIFIPNCSRNSRCEIC